MLNGNRVDAITLKSASGLQVQVLTYGATIASVKVPSKASEAEEVTLCYGDLATLQKKSPYYGCTVGAWNFMLTTWREVGDRKLWLADRHSTRSRLGGALNLFHTMQAASRTASPRASSQWTARSTV